MPWKNINSSKDIPQSVVQRTIEKTKNKLVIDFGSSIYREQHIDFKAKRITRWDYIGVVSCNQVEPGTSIPEILTNNNNEKFVIVFYRVLSILSHEDISYIQNLIYVLKNRIECIIVYDYFYNISRQHEYKYINTTVGEVAMVHVEWWKNGFCHYTLEQLAKIINHPISTVDSFVIPAVNRKDDLGKLVIFDLDDSR